MKTFLKANVASLTASFCDYLITIIFKEVLHFYPVSASIIGTVAGGVINFMIGRHWVFKSSNTTFFYQGKRYLLTWLGNLFLNASGAFLLIEVCGIHYIMAKVITSITVAVIYNYPIQKRYVFKNNEINEKD